MAAIVDPYRMEPGVKYPLSDIAASGGPQPGAAHRANLHRYQLYLALLRGGRYVLRPDAGTLHPLTGWGLPEQSYLTRLPGEKRRNLEQADPFTERCNRAFHVPYCQRFIHGYLSTFGRQPVDRSAVEDKLGSSIMSDVDLRGTSAARFVSTAWKYALACGWCGILTDMPVPGQHPSRAHEMASGARPYSRIYLPTRIWDWEREDGDWKWVLLHESDETWKLWTRDSWSLLDKKGDVIDAGENSLGFVPLDLILAFDGPTDEQSTAPFGLPPIESAADIEIETLNQWSLHCKTERKANFTFLHVDQDPRELDDEHKKKQTAGEEYMLFYAAKVEWIAPATAVMEESRAHLADMQKQMEKSAGVAAVHQDSIEARSGLSLSWEYQPRNDYIRHLADQLLVGELALWRTIGAYVGAQPILDGDVRYPESFTTSPSEMILDKAAKIAAVYSGYDAAPRPVQEFVDKLIGKVARQELGHSRDADDIIADINDIDYGTEETPPVAGEVDAPTTEEVTEIAPSEAEESESGSMAQQAADVEAVLAQLKVVEGLVKARSPQPLIRSVVTDIARMLGVTDEAAISSINDGVFVWYTSPPEMEPAESGGALTGDAEEMPDA